MNMVQAGYMMAVSAASGSGPAVIGLAVLAVCLLAVVFIGFLAIQDMRQEIREQALFIRQIAYLDPSTGLLIPHHHTHRKEA